MFKKILIFVLFFSFSGTVFAVSQTVSDTNNDDAYNAFFSQIGIGDDSTVLELTIAVYNPGEIPSSDFLNGGSCSASGENQTCNNAFDDNTGSRWDDTDGSPWWIKYDLGAGQSKTPVNIRWYRISSTWSPKDWTLHASNNDSDWDLLVTVNGTPQAQGWIDVDFANTTAYRYFRYTIDDNIGAGPEGLLNEWELYEDFDSGSPVSISPTSAGISIVQYDTNSYKGTFPCNGTGCEIFSAEAYTCDPVGRCSGNTVTAGSEVVFLTGSFPGTLTFDSSKYYIFGYLASNNANRLAPVGTTSGSLTWFEDTANYLRVDDFGDHDVFYINQPGQVGTIYYSLNGDAGPPTGNITDESSDPINQTLTFSADYEFNFTGVGYEAKVDIFAQCETAGNEFIIQDHVVAQITWFADDDVTNTIDRGANLYTGAGYTVSDSSGSFSNVVVPFIRGANCIYPTFIRVLDADGNVVYASINEDGPIVLTPTGSTSTIGVADVTDETDVGFFTSLIEWIKSFINQTFGFEAVFAEFPFFIAGMSSIIEVRVPFAYVYTAYNTNLSAPAVGTSIPSLNFDFVDYTGADDYEVVFSGPLTSALVVVRDILAIVIWMLLFFYFVMLGRRLFK